MRLFIAEKPSVARAIADELGVTAKEEGYIICGQDKITWCFGHLLELAEPDRYLSEDIPKSSKTGKKLWRAEDLPIIPEQWIIEPKADTKKQLNLIGALLKEATLIINAGDADREGQL
ncbi:toprim domain-containing protein [Legionella quinlivanii]|nr:toprim domain-containing protein [Legionella quinlivanii]MCW8452563.1 toprim domain-containing protein [Legionella quinlivanii]